MQRTALLLLACLASTFSHAQPADVTPIECGNCTRWNTAQTPFRLFGNSYYIGTRGLSSVLIDTGAGLIVLDGALPQSAPLIAENIRELGFELHDVRWVLSSHAHFDHAGGIAALARMSGAQVAASTRGANALRMGTVTADDPQAGYGMGNAYPAIEHVTEIVDDGTLTLGNTRVRAHYTPGHTPGSTTWSWQSCEAERCVTMVYADSLNAVAAPGFRFSDTPARIAQFRTSIARVALLRCDILVPVHPEFGDLFNRLLHGSNTSRFVNANACQRYATAARKRLQQTIANETVPAPAPSTK
ncbi:MAG: subclass B3 metallo-beta-lactamase [Xanthomonadaceae bacterium]|nr:subclass B3 metallo-beta-lactamase [Xanthomonadaceae bacterium]MDZ4115126.1 subclass B3 metallo-beta-lactamase [Xanthomonadaceae bacterium]MDZ4376554.1 subclass B3 metallo-beta-lactamase [Xanthomonadaceae bacterium]